MLLIVLATLLALLAWVVWMYNQLVRQRNVMREARAGIDVQLTKRHDLVPSLVEIVRGYARHEAQTLEEVTALRAPAEMDVDALNQQENRLSAGITRLFALAEDYPELRASENFQQLSSQLVEVEDHLQYARRYFNGAVRDYNNRVERFPDRFVAAAFSFPSAAFFEVETAGHRTNPDVAL